MSAISVALRSVRTQETEEDPVGERDTTARVLSLLSLLQSRPAWPGSELAVRLGVTTRSIRRDVDRLRELGYPVRATSGVGGGYQLGAGARLPPLLLDDEEAVAVAVSLRLAAGGTVAGASEAALRTLTKLDQVMPPRLRAEVRAIAAATQVLPGAEVEVDGEVLLSCAQACRDTVRLAFDYASAAGETSQRRTEPYRLVATGRRWYLFAFDLDRDDWRTFRLDRMSAVRAKTWRFTPRPHPDPADHVQRAITAAPYRFVARLRVHGAERDIRARLSPATARVERLDDEACLVEAGGDDLAGIAWHLAGLDLPYEVLGPPALRAALAALGERALRASQEAG